MRRRARAAARMRAPASRAQFERRAAAAAANRHASPSSRERQAAARRRSAAPSLGLAHLLGACLLLASLAGAAASPAAPERAQQQQRQLQPEELDSEIQIEQSDSEWQALKRQLAASLNETLSLQPPAPRAPSARSAQLAGPARLQPADQQVGPGAHLRALPHASQPAAARPRLQRHDSQPEEGSAEPEVPAPGPAPGAGGAEAGEPITCSPDYEDSPGLMMESSSGAASSNLSAEQQAQLLSGSADALHEATGGVLQTLVPPAQCAPAGSRMIEVITKIITPILFSIIIVVGLLGNIIVMLVILEDRKTERELTPTNLLILDLSLADLSFIVFCIPFTGWDYAVGHWVFGQVWCKFNQYLIVVCALSSIYTLVLMSMDRFMAIVYPIECMSYRTSSNTLHAIIIKWVIIFFIALPTIAMHGLIESPLGPEQFTCRFLSDQYNALHFQVVFFVTSYLSPLVLIFCLYLSLLNKLWFGNRPHGHKESHKMLESKKKVTWLVASIVIVFALCWCPIQIMLILMRLKWHKITATYVAIQVFAHILGYMNSCINPIVYAFASETFNQSFRRSWFGRTFWRCFHACCCCCASCCAPTQQATSSTAGWPSAAAPGSRSMSLANAGQCQLTANNNSQHHQPPAARMSHAELLTTLTSASSNHRAMISSNSNTSPVSAYKLTGHHSAHPNETCAKRGLQQQSATPGPKVINSPSPLPLEPRDRPSVPLMQTAAKSEAQGSSAQPNQTHQQRRQTNSNHSIGSTSSLSAISQTPTSSGTSYCDYANTTGQNADTASYCSQANCRQATALPGQAQPKQQLVARMVHASNSSQPAVAHECEPCESQSEHHGA